jgi:alkylation response protein AidB-like acyl-CoA dehydrogenase
MNFDLGPDAEAFRAEVAEFLEGIGGEAVADRVHRTGTLHDWDVHRAMAAKGWLTAAWPKEYGGQERDVFEMTAMGEEFARRGVQIEGWQIAELVAHTLHIVGTEQQKRDVVPEILRGEALVCLGYSEPDAGSDVASVRTKATRDGDEWVIDGQKMFTTMAHESKYVFLLARSNPEVPKHKGLTMFLVPMDLPGIEIQPVHTLGGERTNITFYTDVRVPDSCRVGDVDGGWRVMNVALAFERQPAAVGYLDHLVTHARQWAETEDEDGDRPIDRPSVRRRLARAMIDLEVGRLLGYRLTDMTAKGLLPMVEGSMGKLFGSEALVRAGSSLLDATGIDGVLGGDDGSAPGGGWIERGFRHSLVTTIYAGASEIQRGIIAEGRLGLPSTRPRG